MIKVSKITSAPEYLPFSEGDGRIGAYANVRGYRYNEMTRSSTAEVVEAGIPVFPDKRSALHMGVCHITAMKEMWSKKGPFVGYAFAQGDMPQYEWPERADIGEWLVWKSGLDKSYAGAQIEWLRTANNGCIVMIVATASDVTFLTKGPHEDNLCRELDGDEYEAAKECFFCYPRQSCVERSERCVQATELLMELAFGEEADKRFAVDPMEFGVIHEGYGACLPSYQFFSELITEAESIGFLKQYTFAGVCYYRCRQNDSRFWLIRNFSDEEIDEIVQTASRVNRQATEMYRNMVKKGRMKVRSYAGELCLDQEGQR